MTKFDDYFDNKIFGNIQLKGIKMKKIVINECYGGFGLSDKAKEWLKERGSTVYLERHDPLLIECIETLGEKANGFCASLKIVEIPEDVHYVIEEYDGVEHIAEKHRTWS